MSVKVVPNKGEEGLLQMRLAHGLFVISPAELEVEGIYLEQFLCYINRATSSSEVHLARIPNPNPKPISEPGPTP